MTTPLLQMPEYVAGQLQPEIPINTMSRILEQGCTRFVVLAHDLTAPPGGQMDGDAYRVASGASGAWAGKDDHIALFIGTGWYFVEPREGLRYQLAGGLDYVYQGSDSPPSGWTAVVGDGDVLGPGSAVDNRVVRFDGATGKLLQSSPVVVDDNGAIREYLASVNAQTGTTYTLQASDAGRVVEITNGAAITLTLPDSLPVGFACTVVQGGAGQITLSAGGGGSLRNRQGHAKLAGQWAAATIYVRTNSGGSAAEHVLIGDTAA